jgi:hypothetical protein
MGIASVPFCCALQIYGLRDVLVRLRTYYTGMCDRLIVYNRVTRDLLTLMLALRNTPQPIAHPSEVCVYLRDYFLAADR